MDPHFWRGKSVLGLTPKEAVEYRKEVIAEIRVAQEEAAQRSVAAKELTARLQQGESQKTAEDGRQEAIRRAETAEEAARQQAQRDLEAKQALETRIQDRNAEVERHLEEKAKQEFENRLSIPQDEDVALDLEQRASVMFPAADGEAASATYLLLRDGRLLNLPTGPHRTVWEEFIDLPLWLSKTGAIRILATPSEISAEIFSVSEHQKKVLIELVTGKQRHAVIQSYVWLVGVSYYSKGPTVSINFPTAFRLVEILNQFSK